VEFVPDRRVFADLARRFDVVPVTVTIEADRETPISAYQKLVGDRTGFLLESVEGGDRWARWSFLGWDPAFNLVSRQGVVEVDRPGIEIGDGDPLEVLGDLIGRFATPERDDLPPLHSGAVGYLGYDMVRYVERLEHPPVDDRELPEMAWQFVGSLAAFDHFAQTITLVRNVFVEGDRDAAYADATERLTEAVGRLGEGLDYRPRVAGVPTGTPPTTSTFTREEFVEAVRVAKRHILDGDAFQIVLSQRLATSFTGDPFDVYRALRAINPSPFLFYLRRPDVTIAGSSPELMTRVRDGVVFSRPIAGTRPRGRTEDEDRRLEVELLADPKERAEHVMLVDLARNDLGRVCEYGTVSVDDLMVVERYSHVMHIVSGVSGKLRDGVGPVDVLRATFPHGTVSGAPKVRAMEIIDDLEPVARGPYAGAVGYLDFSGNIDTAICLRTVVLAGEDAWVQAGAGIVADSDPDAEYEETMNKAAAALAAIARAQRP